MNRLPLIPGPKPAGNRIINRARKSHYVKPSDKAPEEQKPAATSRPSIMPGWARRYRPIVID